MPQDNWQRRWDGLRCVSCMWYCPKPNPQGVLIGRCRRHAPTMQGYPVVYASDWCGEHKLDETTLPPPAPLPILDDPDGDGLPLHDPTDCRLCQEQARGGPLAPED
jgi:hypothetical protein